MQDGPASPYQVVPLPCSGASGAAAAAAGEEEEGFCPLAEFLAMAGPQAMSPQEWCRACENAEVLICRVK